MHLVVVGLNHRTAPIELREKVSYSPHSLPAALRELTGASEIDEAAILSTCNRTEIYAAEQTGHGYELLTDALCRQDTALRSELGIHVYHHTGVESVKHLFRVASGLDSLVLGEGQILGQVREAMEASKQAGGTKHFLGGLFRAAISTGRRARTETGIGQGGFSIGHAAVDLAKSIFGSLNGATILLLGAGKMSELTAKHLMAGGAKLVIVANRTFDRATQLAERLGGQAIDYSQFPEALINADVLISSTAAPHTIVHRDMVSAAMRKRRGKPLFLIDIAVPRDIDADVRELGNVFLYDVDDLQSVVADRGRERAKEVVRVEAIVDEEADKFLTWARGLQAAPLITALGQKKEALRQAEIARLKNQLPDLPERVWEQFDLATRSLVNQLTRDAIQALRGAGDDPTQEMSLAEATELLFGIRPQVSMPISEPEFVPDTLEGAGCPHNESFDFDPSASLEFVRQKEGSSA